MSLQTTILHLLRDRGKLNLLGPTIPKGDGMVETQAIMAWYRAYLKSNPSAEEVSLQAIREMIALQADKDPDGTALMLALIKQLEDNPPTEGELSAVSDVLYSRRLAAQAQGLIEKWDQGEEIDLAFELQAVAQHAMKLAGMASATDYERTPIEELLEEADQDVGLKFRRWPALRHSIQGVLGGISIAIAARPDRGKTSLVAAILTDWAGQAFKLFGPDRPILWLNNEGKGRRLIPRLYQSALGMTMDDLQKLSKAGKLKEAYEKALGTPSDFIRIKDMHGASMGQIERVIDAVKPSVVVADMLSNFHTGVPGQAAHAETERVWELWREILARHNCVGIGTIQISQEGANMLYPPQSALKESKTGVQGAVDLILMMGNFDQESPELRGLSTPKNKLQRPRSPGYVKCQLVFDPTKCEFVEMS